MRSMQGWLGSSRSSYPVRFGRQTPRRARCRSTRQSSAPWELVPGKRREDICVRRALRTLPSAANPRPPRSSSILHPALPLPPPRPCSRAHGAAGLQIGRQGEELAGVTGPNQRVRAAAGTAEFRVPTSSRRTSFLRSSNEGRLRTGGRAGDQLRNFGESARETGRTCRVCVRENTKISDGSQDFLDSLGIKVDRGLPPR